jgi:hypothetical protein
MTGAVPVTAQESVTGPWNGTFTRGQGTEEFTMVIKQNGEKVTGTLSSKVLSGTSKRSTSAGKEREDVKVEGTLVGDKLTLKVGKQETIEGTVAGDVLTGQSQSGSAATRVVSAKKDK